MDGDVAKCYIPFLIRLNLNFDKQKTPRDQSGLFSFLLFKKEGNEKSFVCVLVVVHTYNTTIYAQLQ